MKVLAVMCWIAELYFIYKVFSITDLEKASTYIPGMIGMWFYTKKIWVMEKFAIVSLNNRLYEAVHITSATANPAQFAVHRYNQKGFLCDYIKTVEVKDEILSNPSNICVINILGDFYRLAPDYTLYQLGPVVEESSVIILQ